MTKNKISDSELRKLYQTIKPVDLLKLGMGAE